MRYLLSPDEEQKLLFHLKDECRLVPLAPREPEKIPDDLYVRQSASPSNWSSKDVLEYIFWAREHGPIRWLRDNPDPQDAIGQVSRTISREAGLDLDVVDLETTPNVSWTRPIWYDESKRWIVPSRLRSTRTTFSRLTPEYRKMYRAVEAYLQRNGEKINSWDIPNSTEVAGNRFEPPRNKKNFEVIVWPKAAIWLDAGVKIYHWDA